MVGVENINVGNVLLFSKLTEPRQPRQYRNVQKLTNLKPDVLVKQGAIDAEAILYATNLYILLMRIFKYMIYDYIYVPEST